MGRGRAKAKQAKVARELKYNSGGTDLDRLRAEIVGDQDDNSSDGVSADRVEDADDPYEYPDEDDSYSETRRSG